MIITSEREARALLSGRQTRMTCQGRKRWKVDGIHAVAVGSTSNVLGHVLVTGVTRIRLGSLTEEDAKAENCTGLHSLRHHWRTTEGPWDPDLEVWDLRTVPYKVNQTSLFGEGRSP